MSIESLGTHRPMAEPVRGRRTERLARREAAAPRGKSFDAAEVRGGRAPVRQGTEEVLGKLHERGLLTNVSRPLGPDGQPIQSREPDAELRVRTEETQREQMPEGRVYGRPRPQEAPRQDGGVFTIKLYSPKEDTGKTLRIGDHVIPLEADGSILAGMPDGTVRRITFDQDVMDEMVARGEVWMEGDEPAGSVEADYAGAGTEGFNDMQKQLIRKAYDLLKRQAELAKAANFENMPRHAPASTELQEKLVGDGEWSVDTLTGQIIDYAKELAGDDPEKLSQLRDAFVRAHANYALEHGNGVTTGVTAQTFAETLREFDALTVSEVPKETETPAEDTPPRSGEAAGANRVGKGNPALVAQLKAELEHRQAEMLKLVRDMLGKQGKAVSGDGIWRTLAGGNFSVDAKTRAEAQKHIAEDGYWGVEQTSDRIVQFAIGLAGSSPEMLDKMEAAFEKGYAEAEKKWGGALPAISQQTRQRVHEKFAELRKQNGNESGETVFATITARARTIEEETER